MMRGFWRGWFVVLGPVGCTATDGAVATQAVPVAAAADVWATRGGEQDICAWAGQTFAPADFAAVPTKDASNCEIASRCAWKVAGNGDAVRAMVEAPASGDEAKPPKMPFTPPEDWYWEAKNWRDVQILPVVDGALVAYETVMPAVGVYWFSADWATHEKISDERVVGLFTHGDEVWAPTRYLGGTTPGDPDVPRPVLRFARSPGVNKWRATPLPATLQAGAEVAVQAGDRILVATPRSIEAIAGDGTIRVLATPDWRYDTKTSIALGAGDEIYVGKKARIARFTPSKGGRHVEEWLVPPACKQWGYLQGGSRCLCKGLVGAETLVDHPG